MNIISLERLGHASIQITPDTYSHVSPDFKRRQQLALTRLLAIGIISVKMRLLKTVISKNGNTAVMLSIWGQN
jgi:hypothetical protein